MGLLFFYLFLAVFVSFLCSIMEAVLLSTPLSYVTMKEKQGVKAASFLRKHKEDVDKPLSAILSLNTVSHTIGAAGVGAQASIIFGDAYFGLVSATLTIIILLFSEILPKTIGAYYWKSLVVFAGIVIEGMIYLTYPLVLISRTLTNIISNKKESENYVSREEFSVLVDIGTKEGVINIAESRIIQNIIKLRDVKVEEVMTPRVVVETAPENMTIAEFHIVQGYKHYTRIPIFSAENNEDITGFVNRQDVIENMANDNFDLQLSSIKRELLVVPNLQPLTVLWERLLAKKAHIALVVDEYGGFEGIVTLEDVLETILGLEIMDERDVAPDLQQFARERWKQRLSKYKDLSK
ncbi:MAG: CNNM domain-containing protein [Bacteroidales bacterium]